MDIAINPVSGVFRLTTPPAVTPAAANATDTSTAPATQATASAGQTQDQNAGNSNSVAAASTAVESKYEAAVQQIAQSFKGSYAVSDKDFTIFKDATGKYITRYVSLRDGSITYSPAAPAVTRPPAASVSVTA